MGYLPVKNRLEILGSGSHHPWGIIPGMIFWKNFRTGHIDTGGVGVPSPGFPPGAGRGGRVARAPASGRGPRGSSPLRLARQLWRWRRGEGGGLSQEGRWGGTGRPRFEGGGERRP